MATQKSSLQINLSSDVDIDDVSIPGEDLLRFYIDEPLEQEVQYKLSGKDKKFFDLDDHGTLSFGDTLTRENIEARSNRVDFKIKDVDAASNSSDQEILSLNFVTVTDEELISLQGEPVSSKGGVVGAIHVVGLGDDNIVAISVSDERFKVTEQNGVWVLNYSGGTLSGEREEGKIDLTLGVLTDNDKFLADKTVVGIRVGPQAPGIDGGAEDGYITGALVWADSTTDGVYNLGEASSVTDAYGNYTLTGNLSGYLHMTGGTDVATLLPFAGEMRAPAGSSVISPVTTLIVAVMGQGGGMTAQAAEDTVKAAFGLAAGVDLTQYDPIAVLANPTSSGAEKLAASNVFGLGSTVLNAATIAGKLLQGNTVVTTPPTFLEAEAAVYDALAAEIINTGGLIDLTVSTTIGDIVDAAAALLGFLPGEVQSTDVATVISAANTLVAQALPATEGDAAAAVGNTILEQTTQVSAAAQGVVANAASDGEIDPTDVTNYSGAGLVTQVGTTPIGNVDPSTILGTAGNDSLVGNNVLDDLLRGLAGDDNLRGLTGDDTLDGGAGNDTADYSTTPYGMIVNLAAGQAQDNNGTPNDPGDDGALETDSLVSIENIIGTGFGDNLQGDNFANTINGGDGDDFLTGGQAVDTIDGGNGFDFVSFIGDAPGFGDPGLNISIAGTTVTSINSALGETETAINVEGVTGSLGSDTITGDSENNTINDVVGGNVIDGVGGINTLNYLDVGLGALTVDLSAGSASGSIFGADTISNIDNILIANVGPFGAGWEGATLIGNGLANNLTGGTQDDTINGMAGNDTLTGGGGADTFYYVDGADIITDFEIGTDKLNFELSSFPVTTYAFLVDNGYINDGLDGVEIGAGPQSITLNGVTAAELTPDHFIFTGQTLVGDAFDNNLVGGDGDDLIAAGAGSDTIDGGLGSNTIDYSNDNYASQFTNGGEGVRVNLLPIGWTVGGTPLNSNEAQDPDGGIDILANIQNVIGTDNDDFIFGNVWDGNTVVDGRGGNDELLAGGGALTGGAGLDTFIYFNGSDTITDFTPGDDHISLTSSGLPVFDLGDLMPLAYDDAQGNAVIDFSTVQFSDGSFASGRISLQGKSIFELDPGGGDFVLSTGLYIEGDSGGVVTDDNLIGYEKGNDTLSGLDGNDTLNGLGGNDILIGGAGMDTFVFGSAAGNDIIQDFNYGEGDRVQLLDSLTVTSYNDSIDADLDGSTDDTVVALSDGATITLIDAIVMSDGELLI